MSSPIPRLEALSDIEKEKLISVFKGKFIVKLILFLSMILFGIGVMIYFNKYSSNYKVEDNLEVINVVFVVMVVVCSRFLISEFSDYRKEVKSPNKKIILTRVAGRSSNKIMLGNKAFGKADILLDSSDFDLLNRGDEVRLEISAVSNTLFAVKQISKQ